MTADLFWLVSTILLRAVSVIYVILAFGAFGKDQHDRAVFCMTIAMFLLLAAK